MNAWEVVDALALVLGAEPWRLDSPNRVERRLTLADPKTSGCFYQVQGFMPANRIVIRKPVYGTGYRDIQDVPEAVVEPPSVEAVMAVLMDFNAHRTDWK